MYVYACVRPVFTDPLLHSKRDSTLAKRKEEGGHRWPYPSPLFVLWSTAWLSMPHGKKV